MTTCSWAVLVSFGEARTFFAGRDPDSCLGLPASSGGSMMASIRLFTCSDSGGGKKEEVPNECRRQLTSSDFASCQSSPPFLESHHWPLLLRT